MSPVLQVAMATVAALVFLARLVLSLHAAQLDGRAAERDRH